MDQHTIEQIDSDPILSALYGALNLQCAVAYACAEGPSKGLDGPYHFDRIREAIVVRTAELDRGKPRYVTHETMPDGSDPRPFPFPIRCY